MTFYGVSFPNCPSLPFVSAVAKYPGLCDLSDNQVAYLELASVPEGHDTYSAVLRLPNGKRLYPGFAGNNGVNHNLPFEDYALGLDLPYLESVDFVRAVEMSRYACHITKEAAPSEVESEWVDVKIDNDVNQYGKCEKPMVDVGRWLSGVISE